ncbi:MAG: glycosyltransferase [Candidatus Aminicenantes bacterium]|nr:MAG: glycosyltransferase [Candidatus Aminicenantes bacterium]
MAKLTVLMTVYNGGAYLRETIESILNQTYKDFKFLIIDNASTDNSREVIGSFNDPRIDLVALPENIGQIPALNKGLDMIDTPYIARMDADDISLPHRFKRQVAFMEKHPDVGVCGTFVITFRGKKENRYTWPCQSADLKVKLLFECTIAHPSVMLRKSLFDKYRLRYNETLGHSEDWELWQRAGRCFELANIPLFLLRYRIHEGNESFKIFHRQREAAEKLDAESLKPLKLQNHPLRSIHRDVAFETFNAKNREPQFIHHVKEWFDQLKHANQNHQVYDENALNRFLKERLFIVLTNNTYHWRSALRMFRKEELRCCVPSMWTWKFMAKILWAMLKPKPRNTQNTRKK